MRRHVFTTTLVCLSTIALATACSDAPSSKTNGIGPVDASGLKDGINLGDAIKDGAKVDGVPDTGSDDVAMADMDDAEDAVADVAPTGCTADTDCVGKVEVKVCETAVCDVATGQCSAKTADDGATCAPGDACFQDGACQSGACTGKTAISCDDGNPCTDDSCVPATGCLKTNNTAACDDGDAATVGDKCMDGACMGGTATCANTKELNCADKIDDDCDGATDCADNECAADAGCKAVTKEANCADKIDDDADGKTDCDDNDCSVHDECKPVTNETNCTDGKDDDLDGTIDCADNDCANAVNCATPLKEANCTDKADDDKDGKIDCADNDCATDAACVAVASETDCGNKVDDDKDGATDCADNDCSAALACAVTVETDCGNKVDEDKDGKTDCADSDCAKAPACTAAATETNCTDKLDDDKDGLVDCNDGDCSANTACKVTCNVCAVNTKALDPKCDACAAAVCKADDFCCTDSWDSTCVNEVKQYCGKQCEGLCGDKKDNDGDLKTDCADNDCAADLACTATKTTTCTAAAAIACGASNSGSTADKAATKALDAYTCADGKASQETGPEYTYEFTAECDGPVTVSVQKTSTKAGFLDLFILDAAKGCAGTSCLAHGVMAGTAGKATVTAKKGAKYFVVVDGFADFSGEFSLKIACGCAGGKEVNCGDKVDNDTDGTTDCADADCVATLACTPSSETSCTNKVDDDKDGKIDCADGDCAVNAACAPTSETNCTDKVDNDKDGKLDCLDADCVKDLACAPTTVEGNCTNKVDDDKDGKVDCADSDCTGKTGCMCKADFTLTTGSTDSWNNAGTGSTKVVNDYVCKDGTATNETGSEYTYGFTSDCDGDLTVTVSKKTSGAGYLDLFILDGTKPCGGTSCIGHALMGTTTASKTLPVTKGEKLLIVVDGYQNFSGDYSIKSTCAKKELNCKDKKDNDADGKTDCADTDCAADAACKVAPEANCTDKVDNDKDGKTDCADTDCATTAACKNPTTEISCVDKVDNDKDGKTDCADSDCTADVACKTPTVETLCSDGKDDDKDGKIDCADSDCVGKAACTCKGDFPLACGGSDSFGNANPGSTKVVNEYVCKDGSVSNETGSEYTYDFTATCDGDVTVTLTKTSAASNKFLDLFVLDGDKVCAGTSCLAHSLMASNTATLKFKGVKGKAYRIVVDGYDGYSGNYTLKVACGCAPTTEANCTNKVDDDKDGKVDCADSDCATNAACAAPQCKDDTVIAMGCSTTDNWSNNGEGSTDAVDSYTCADAPGQTFSSETGAEYSYTFTADCTGTATVKLTKTSDKSKYLDLFILDGSKPCAGASCTAHALMFSNTATASFPATKGQKFHVVVDGFQNFSSDYEIVSSCACK